MAEIVIGIDGGGTYTRVAAADLSGRILTTAVGGAASPNKTAHARENVQNAIREATKHAGCRLEDVVGLVAGIAGLDSPDDQRWAETFTNLPGLECSRLHVNDAVVAHAGALRSQPGIIAISGTGSIVFGVTEAGRHLRNYDFHQYANSSARHLAYEVVHRILANDVQAEDGPFVADVLAYWQTDTVAQLHERGVNEFIADRFERDRMFGEMAPLVTDAALNDVPLAVDVCNAAAYALGIGIRLLGHCFAGDTVNVALIGGVVHSAYMQQAVAFVLERGAQKRLQIVEAAYTGEAGAVLMALRRRGIVIDAPLLGALGRIGVNSVLASHHNT